ncbi:GNAT family N-acetyltransferase [Robiginitalea sp. M366]|uniref:GNAT family N-acetyltransferase n=1 Tax=Robiginitalea aestuariiviva TaxID=3036903 RepID=UPI00240DC81B|nr:GNAT family N-acetyltransferase [Robiginitalea aestuariiviva]MDG1571419.1 GNAT family N-acetyltransferase [Robiginitalea aestuariiviva]
MAQFALIDCTPEDLEALRQLSIHTFTEAFAAQNNPEDFQAYLESAFHPKQLLSEIHHPQTRFSFICKDGMRVGYLKVNWGNAQTELQEDAGMELERIYVLASEQGAGIGAWVLEQVGQWALAAGKEYVWLGVWEHNPRAMAFYQRHGFVIFDKHPYYIGQDRQMDWMMRWEINPKP